MRKNPLKMNKKSKKAVFAFSKKFIKRSAIRIGNKLVDIAILIFIGSAMGLHLVRY